MAKWVKHELLSGKHEHKIPQEKVMERILQEYPYIEEEDPNKFDTDEEPEQEENQQANMKVYVQNLTSQMTTLVTAMK